MTVAECTEPCGKSDTRSMCETALPGTLRSDHLSLILFCITVNAGLRRRHRRQETKQQAEAHSERIPLNGQARQKKQQLPANRCKPTRNGMGTIIESAAASTGQPRRAGAEGAGQGEGGMGREMPFSLGRAGMAGAQIRLSKD